MLFSFGSFGIKSKKTVMYKVPKVRIPEIPRSLINHIQSSNKNV